MWKIGNTINSCFLFHETKCCAEFMFSLQLKLTVIIRFVSFRSAFFYFNPHWTRSVDQFCNWYETMREWIAVEHITIISLFFPNYNLKFVDIIDLRDSIERLLSTKRTTEHAWLHNYPYVCRTWNLMQFQIVLKITWNMHRMTRNALFSNFRENFRFK